MKPIKFKEQNTVFAENQSEYLPLPAFKNDGPMGDVISCWDLSFKERLKILFTGKLWVSLAMFGKPLTPAFLSVYKSDVFEVPPNFTLLGCINYLVQFLFIRIYKGTKDGKPTEYGILYFVLPLSGWYNNYVVLNKDLKFKKLWSIT